MTVTSTVSDRDRSVATSRTRPDPWLGPKTRDETSRVRERQGGGPYGKGPFRTEKEQKVLSPVTVEEVFEGKGGR